MEQENVTKSEVLKTVLVVLQIALTVIAGYAASSIKEVERSINQLNVNVAVLIADSSNKQTEISDLKKRISDIEEGNRK